MKENKKIDGLGERLHFLSPETIASHKTKLEQIYNSVTNALQKYPNFDGISFVDVSGGGIQVNLLHKKVKGYAYLIGAKIKYDFSNCKEVITQSIESWEKYDTPKELNSYIKFLREGEKYGWA